MRAILPYLEDLMRKNQQFAHIEAISTGGIAKENRITYALQGLMEHGRIVFNEDENWDEIKREMLAFPSKRVHDDLLDVLAYIQHVQKTSYLQSSSYDSYEYEEFDSITGV